VTETPYHGRSDAPGRIGGRSGCRSAGAGGAPIPSTPSADPPRASHVPSRHVPCRKVACRVRRRHGRELRGWPRWVPVTGIHRRAGHVQDVSLVGTCPLCRGVSLMRTCPSLDVATPYQAHAYCTAPTPAAGRVMDASYGRVASRSLPGCSREVGRLAVSAMPDDYDPTALPRRPLSGEWTIAQA
jgi:hypothetical protein